MATEQDLLNLPPIRKEGLFADYNQETFKNTLYFAKDVNRLFYNGIDYSSFIADGSVDYVSLSKALQDKIDEKATKVEVDTKLSDLKNEILGGEGLRDTFDTLKEIQDWSDKHGTDYTELVATVNTLETKHNNDKTELDNSISDLSTTVNENKNEIDTTIEKLLKRIENLERIVSPE